MRVDTVWKPRDKSDDWHVMEITWAHPIPSCYLFISPQKQKDKMRSGMKARVGGAFGELGESRESKETKGK